MKIFVSYRRSDSRHVAARVSDHLKDFPGVGAVFIDVDGISPGANFKKRIDEALEEIDSIISENPDTARLLMLLNKADLSSDWEMDDSAVRELRARFPVYVTSAKTGEHVEEAFEELTRQMLGLGSSAE